MVDCGGLEAVCNMSNLLNVSCNNSSNSTRYEDVQPRDFVAQWGVLKLIQICCYILIAIVGSLGNILTILVLLKPQNRSKTSSILLLNLAVCDVCIAAIGIPLDLGELVPGNWYYGKEMCNFIYPFQTSLPVVSSWTLLFMLAERNMIFSKHITTGLRARAVRLLAVTTWILPLALVVPYGMKLYLAPVKGVGSFECREDWARPVDRQIYTVALFVTEYLVPIVAITLFVANIGSYLRKERKSVRKNALGLDKRTSKRRLRTNIRLTMIFIVIVTLYAALKLPNNVFWLWVEFGGGGESPHFNTIWTSVGLCSYATSMTNPFVLGAMSADFRKEFIQILTCRYCCCCKRKASSSFSPFSSTTIVSYKKINRICKAAADQNLNDSKMIHKTPPAATTNGKIKPIQSPSWKRSTSIGRSGNRRKTVKYKYSDLLPDSGPDSPLGSPFKADDCLENDKPLIDVETSQQGSDQMHIVCIMPGNQWSGSPSTVEDNGLPFDANVTSCSESNSRQSLCVFFPEDTGECQFETRLCNEREYQQSRKMSASLENHCIKPEPNKFQHRSHGDLLNKCNNNNARCSYSFQRERQINSPSTNRCHYEATMLYGHDLKRQQNEATVNETDPALTGYGFHTCKKYLHERGFSEDSQKYSTLQVEDSNSLSTKQSNSYPNLNKRTPCKVDQDVIDINDNVVKDTVCEQGLCRTRSASLPRIECHQTPKLDNNCFVRW